MISTQEGIQQRQELLEEKLEAHSELQERRESRNKLTRFLAALGNINGEEPDSIIETSTVSDLIPFCTDAELRKLRAEVARERSELIPGIVKTFRFRIDNQCRIKMDVRLLGLYTDDFY